MRRKSGTVPLLRTPMMPLLARCVPLLSHMLRQYPVRSITTKTAKYD